MAKRFDYKKLFEVPRAPVVYASDEAEIEAVARGKKPIAYYAAALDEAEDLVRAAYKHDLLVVAAAAEQLFVTPPGELWRVPAIRTLLDAGGDWSERDEEQLGVLLGYTPAQRRAWLAFQRHQRAAYGAATLYMLTDDPTTLFDYPDHVIKRTARGVSRVAIDWEVAPKLIDYTKQGVRTVKLDDKRADLATRGLRSKVQVLANGVWT